MKTRFPVKVTSKGVTAKITPATQIQNGTTYNGFMVVYWVNGKRKRAWRSNLSDAQTAAQAACEEISSGNHLALELTNHDRMTYLRAIEPLAPLGIELDVAARDRHSQIIFALNILCAIPFELNYYFKSLNYFPRQKASNQEAV